MEKQEFFQKAKDLIECCSTIYLGTINRTLNSGESRAMANIRCLKKYPQNRLLFKENDLSNYIITAKASDKTKELLEQEMVSLYYYCEEYHRTLTIFGHTEIVEDSEIKNKLWSDEWKMYFSNGQEDDNYAVFKFTPKVAKYYDLKFDKVIMNL